MADYSVALIDRDTFAFWKQLGEQYAILYRGWISIMPQFPHIPPFTWNQSPLKLRQQRSGLTVTPRPQRSLFLNLLYLVPFLFSTPCFAQDIAILLSGDIPVYHQAVTGFRSALSPSTEVREYVLGQPLSEDRQFGRQIRASNPDLIFAVGGKAARLAKVEIVDQPIVYCMVLHPETSLIPTPNMTGILMTIPSAQQLASMRTVLPQLQRVGLIYSQNHTPFVKHAAESARGLGLTLVTSRLTQNEDMPETLRTLLPQVDALWLLRDPAVVNAESLRFLMQTTLEFNVPVFGFTAGLMRHGALATLSLDYQQIGRQAGRLAHTIMNQELTHEDLPPPQYPQLPLLALNLNAADFLGVTPSKHSLQLAAELFGGPGAFAQQDRNDPFFMP